MTEPPPRAMRWSADTMTVFHTPVTLMSIVSLKIWGVTWSHVAGMQMPALATTMSRPPRPPRPRGSRSRASPRGLARLRRSTPRAGPSPPRASRSPPGPVSASRTGRRGAGPRGRASGCRRPRTRVGPRAHDPDPVLLQ